MTTATMTDTRTDEQIQQDVFAELKWDARVRPNEIGVAVNTSDTGANPFYFASETFAAVTCPTPGGCTVNVPMLPDRIAYYRIKWRNSSHVVVQTSGIFAVAYT